MVDLNFENPDLGELSKMEWLVTNGIGGYASGTVSGVLSRRYHGLLVASLKPPVDRVNMVVKMDEWAQVGGNTYPLFANQWFSAEDELVPPSGCGTLKRFYHDGQIPTWLYELGSNTLEKKIWMEYGDNTTYIRLAHLAGEDEIRLTLKALLAYTNFHHTNQRGHDYSIEEFEGSLRVLSGGGAKPYYILSRDFKFQPLSIWMEKFYLHIEDYRGLDALTDLYNGADLVGVLKPGESISVVISTDPEVGLDVEAALVRRKFYETVLVEKWQSETSVDWAIQLPLSADQFIVQREVVGKKGHSIIAGYHWFSDWGRDTMIALPGLTLATGRFEVAESILRTFATFLDEGMLPNRFPDLGEKPVYNTIDATLWYFEAVYLCYQKVAKVDLGRAKELIIDLFPKLEEIIHHHQDGTRYDIHVDQADGLLYGGREGVQLTWMDAKVENFVVTPRIGKPVEINGLWYSALCIMSEFSEVLGQDPVLFKKEAEKVKKSFERFWNPAKGYCYDVLDGPRGDDDSLRPNQVLAVAVSNSPLKPKQKKQLLEALENNLFTRRGLRSLAKGEEGYVSVYGGNIWQRDIGYHQGTVWGWLMGPYLIADFQVNRDKQKVLSILKDYCEEMNVHGLGSISEIFDGDQPHYSRGCIAQAWSVAAALWVLDQVEEE